MTLSDRLPLCDVAVVQLQGSASEEFTLFQVDLASRDL